MKTIHVDQSAWGKLRVTGADRVRFLQGMLSNDVATLAVAGWCRATMLNVKGRVMAVVDALQEGESILLLTEPVTAGKVREVLQKYAIMDDVEFTAVELPAHRIWGSQEEVWTAAPILAAVPGTPSPDADVEIRRVEAGLPRYGADVSEDYFPFEANLDRAISYTKGCYIGQEVVARANARGQANKRLVGLRLDDAAAGAAAGGTTLSSAVRPEAGTITSSVVSPDFGPIALAYVHKSSWDPGTRVTLAGGREATVVALPFAAA